MTTTTTGGGVLPVVGVDPGARWTAAVLRVGDEPVTGWTLGPTDAHGQLCPTALDDPDDLAALARYCGRIIDGVDVLVERAVDDYGRCRLAVEAVRVPTGWVHGRPGHVKLGDWITPRTLVVALAERYPAAVLVPPGRNGQAPRESYPPQLRLRRPPSWGPNDHPKGERDHERSAWDVAGAALTLEVPA